MDEFRDGKESEEHIGVKGSFTSNLSVDVCKADQYGMCHSVSSHDRDIGLIGRQNYAQNRTPDGKLTLQLRLASMITNRNNLT